MNGDAISSLTVMIFFVLLTAVEAFIFFIRQKGIHEAQKNIIMITKNRTVPMASLFLSTDEYRQVEADCPRDGDARPNPAYLHKKFLITRNPLFHEYSS